MADRPVSFVHLCRKCGIRPTRTPDSRAHCVECHAACKREYMSRYYADRRENWNAKAKQDRRADPTAYREKERARWPKRKEAASRYKKRRWADLSEQEREERRQRLSEWKAANPEKARAIERRRQERINSCPVARRKAAERMKRWRENNPVGAAAVRDRRRARDVGAEGEYTQDDIRAILKAQGRYCYYCSTALTKFECDHSIPLARGGTNKPDNIVLSCPSCNYSKGAKLPWEWKPDRFTEASKPRG